MGGEAQDSGNSPRKQVSTRSSGGEALGDQGGPGGQLGGKNTVAKDPARLARLHKDVREAGQPGALGRATIAKLASACGRTARKVLEAGQSVSKASVAGSLLAAVRLNLWGLGATLLGLQVCHLNRAEAWTGSHLGGYRINISVCPSQAGVWGTLFFNMPVRAVQRGASNQVLCSWYHTRVRANECTPYSAHVTSTSKWPVAPSASSSHFLGMARLSAMNKGIPCCHGAGPS